MGEAGWLKRLFGRGQPDLPNLPLVYSLLVLVFMFLQLGDFFIHCLRGSCEIYAWQLDDFLAVAMINKGVDILTTSLQKSGTSEYDALSSLVIWKWTISYFV